MVKRATSYDENGNYKPLEHDTVEWKPWMSVAAVVLLVWLFVLLTALFFVGV